MEELLHPRHPLDKYHQSQLEFLAALPVVEHRRGSKGLFGSHLGIKVGGFMLKTFVFSMKLLPESAIRPLRIGR